MDSAMRYLALPAIDVWEKILSRKVTVEALEDNGAILQITRTGKHPSLRHISRVHGVSIAWLHDFFKQYCISGKYQYTGGQHADIFTNIFEDRPSWNAIRSIVGINPPHPAERW